MIKTMWGTPQLCFPDFCKSTTYCFLLLAKFQDLRVTPRREHAFPDSGHYLANLCFLNELSPWLHTWMSR